MDLYYLIKRIFERDMKLDVISINKCKNHISNLNNIFIIETKDKKYIFKMYRHKGYPEENKMIFISKWLTENNIPHAKTCIYNRNDGDLPNGYIIEEHLPGIAADRLNLTEQESCDMYKRLAILTSKIHKIKFSRYGFIINGIPDCYNFTKHIEDNFIYGNHKIQNAYTAEELNKIKHILIEKLKPLDNILPCLSHIDIQLKNIIIDNDNITLIDWDDARSFPMIVDIARLTLLIELNYDNEQAENERRAEIFKKAYLNNYESDDGLYSYKKFETALHVWHGLIILNYCDDSTPQYYKIKTIVDEKLKKLKNEQ